MWQFNKYGFFSIVRVREDEKGVPEGKPYVIRARMREDLEQLDELLFLPKGGLTIVEISGRDYPYRIYLSPLELQNLMDVFARSIDYTNFKDAVKKKQGPARADLYSRVWSVMYDAAKWIADWKPYVVEKRYVPTLEEEEDYYSRHYHELIGSARGVDLLDKPPSATQRPPVIAPKGRNRQRRS